MDTYLIFIALILSAFFSGMEIAYVASNKLRMEVLRKQKQISTQLLSTVTANPSLFLGTMLVGNNIALIVLGIIMAKMLEPRMAELLPPLLNHEIVILTIQTLITTAVVLIFGEFIPKNLFRLNPEWSLQTFAIPLFLAYIVLYPLVQFIVVIAHLLLKVFLGITDQGSPPVFSRTDLEHFVSQFVRSDNPEEEINTTLLEKALYLKEVRARECMVPRTEIEALDVNASVEELRQKFIETKLSRIIIYEDSIDNILGYVHHFDLLKKPQHIRDILFPIKVIPETMLARDILSLFMKDHQTIVWVVDEFGGTSGIVTLEDVLEEIFGEIKDEHDTEYLLEKQVAEDEYIFSGRIEIDYLNEKYDLAIPDGDYETLAGFILAHYEDLPQKGEELIIGRFKIKILNASETRIESVRLKILQASESAG
ncbi:MAG: hemolysin [Chitinophagales bacterium]|nr:MAG: hemolysin [Chitinophagales bacterium]